MQGWNWVGWNLSSCCLIEIFDTIWSLCRHFWGFLWIILLIDLLFLFKKTIVTQFQFFHLVAAMSHKLLKHIHIITATQIHFFLWPPFFYILTLLMLIKRGIMLKFIDYLSHASFNSLQIDSQTVIEWMVTTACLYHRLSRLKRPGTIGWIYSK